MTQSVVEAYKQLYHYTTAKGLNGIVESQQLRATNISYLNDSEELTGFFNRRLLHLLEEPIRAHFTDMQTTTSGRTYIDAEGGLEHVVTQSITKLGALLRSHTLKFHAPHVTSFCAASPQDPDDGLLSQWRGYGPDGGYAIVFETHRLQQLIDQLPDTYLYQFGCWGDVEYYDQDSNEKAAHSETLEREATVKQTIRTFVRDPSNSNAFCELYAPITALSCMHKHRGFREEAEVRIVAVPANDEVFEAAQKRGNKKPKHPVHFVEKHGVLVPYIMLFGDKSSGTATKLPISKVIVGTHPEKFKRQKAVDLMLKQHGIKAEVTVSDIPYLDH